MSALPPGARLGDAELAAAIVAVAQHRDHAAFAQVFRHCMPVVKRYARRTGAGPDLAEEIAQDVLTKIWRVAARYDPALGSAGGWVFVVARNHLTTLQRRRRRTLPESDLTAAQQLAAIGPAADDILLVDERDRRLRAAIETLPPKLAQVVRLAVFEERSYRDIATIIGMSRSVVQHRLRAALFALRKVLKDTAGGAKVRQTKPACRRPTPARAPA